MVAAAVRALAVVVLAVMLAVAVIKAATPAPSSVVPPFAHMDLWMRNWMLDSPRSARWQAMPTRILRSGNALHEGVLRQENCESLGVPRLGPVPIPHPHLSPVFNTPPPPPLA